MDDVEIEHHGGFLRLIRVSTSANRRDRTTDQASENFVKQAHAVAFVAAER